MSTKIFKISERIAEGVYTNRQGVEKKTRYIDRADCATENERALCITAQAVLVVLTVLKTRVAKMNTSSAENVKKFDTALKVVKSVWRSLLSTDETPTEAVSRVYSRFSIADGMLIDLLSTATVETLSANNSITGVLNARKACNKLLHEQIKSIDTTISYGINDTTAVEGDNVADNGVTVMLTKRAYHKYCNMHYNQDLQLLDKNDLRIDSATKLMIDYSAAYSVCGTYTAAAEYIGQRDSKPLTARALQCQVLKLRKLPRNFSDKTNNILYQNYRILNAVKVYDPDPSVYPAGYYRRYKDKQGTYVNVYNLTKHLPVSAVLKEQKNSN